MPPIPYEQLRSALVFRLPYVAIAAICLAGGVAAIALSLLRSRDRLLLWFGVFANVYGIRLFCENDLVRTAFSWPSLNGLIKVLTYAILIPSTFFFRELLGCGWKSSIQILVWVAMVFAPVAVFADLIAGYSRAAALTNNILVIATFGLVLGHLLARRQESGLAALTVCIMLFTIPVFGNNLGLGRPSLALEPYGFLILTIGLAYTAAQHALSRERKLLAVENELATARRIQASILPRSTPKIPCLDVAASYRPMAQVAGDFYDFLAVDDSGLTILIADVSGHGVPAALIASMLKVAFAQQANNAGDPAAVLCGVNTILTGIPKGQFITAACACIDLKGQQITYSGAGHPPPILVRSGGDSMELSQNGLLLGPFRQASYANMTIPFQPGDCLMLYTDGIIEAAYVDGEPFGRERLRDFFASQRGFKPAAIADALMNTLSTREQQDDLTVVIAHYM